MTPEVYNPLDTSLKGEAEAWLRDPLVTLVSTAKSDAKFDPSRKQQLWAYPPGTGDVEAFQFRVSADGSEARLVDYFIPAEIATKPNVQANPTKDGYVAKRAPTPLRQLTGDEKLVLVRIEAGIIVVNSWWIRVGEPTVPPPSPAGGSFTDADRADLKSVKMMVSKILANQQ